jgi:molybdate transport system ATP-binding protein
VSSSDQIVFRLENATIARLDGTIAIRNLNWSVREQETWAVVGPNASGKSTLGEFLAGNHRLVSGTLEWPLLNRIRKTSAWTSHPSVKLVSFKEESKTFSYSKHYYQQRFNFIEPEDDLTLDTFLHSGRSVSESELVDVTDRLHIRHLRFLSLLKLSNGEMRRARIAKALLTKPELLILDDPFMGLDVSGRAELVEILQQQAKNGLRMIFLSRPDRVPDLVTHRLELNRDLSLPSEIMDEVHSELQRNAPKNRANLFQEPIIQLKDINISYGDRAILKNIHWSVNKGDRWALIGPNGSGKTTLLSLICADNPQAYSNDIELFGRRRGTGESIWEIKKRIGFVSPEFHLCFSEPLTCLEVVHTGFFDILVRRPTSIEQKEKSTKLFSQFRSNDLMNRPFQRLSTGQQRFVLFLRALVKDPELFILDEPFQGFDESHSNFLRDWLDQNLQSDQTLIFVSHHDNELPRTISHRIRLRDGQIESMG